MSALVVSLYLLAATYIAFDAIHYSGAKGMKLTAVFFLVFIAWPFFVAAVLVWAAVEIARDLK